MSDSDKAGEELSARSPKQSSQPPSKAPPNSVEKPEQTNEAQRMAETNRRLSFMRGLTGALKKLTGQRRKRDAGSVDSLAASLENVNSSAAGPSATSPRKRRKSSLCTHLGQPKIW